MQESENLIIEKLNKLINLIEPLVTSQGLKVSGIGILAENSKKQIELLDKIQKFLYFMEKRQKEDFDKKYAM